MRLLFTLLAAFVSGVLFGLLPALQVRCSLGRGGMQDGSRGSSGKRACVGSRWAGGFRTRLRLYFAGGRGAADSELSRVLDVNPGFQPERAAALRIDPSFRISGLARQNSYIDEVLQRARALPGVAAAGMTDVLPLAEIGRGRSRPEDMFTRRTIIRKPSFAWSAMAISRQREFRLRQGELYGDGIVRPANRSRWSMRRWLGRFGRARIRWDR